ncbi:hypothetical protein DPMN_072159 [Dreissena polymorpha]|uniref:Uncharacterized protein n=1 Tax=Dreissena polymorpha TaxID=45954 RepID=A0A9D4BWQ5_DREPO|nr:hypothetical protein DPMN_072159 [Dreissena polymorpha]
MPMYVLCIRSVHSENRRLAVWMFAIIERLCDLEDQRNKLLKIADKHGWDTVRDYDEHPLADNDDDAAKLRSASARANRNRRFRPYDDSGRSKDYGASSIQPSSQFFRGPLARFGEARI